MTHRLQTDKPKRHRAVAGTLAAALAGLMLSTTAAVAAPTFNTEQAVETILCCHLISLKPSASFKNAGTNPRFTKANFSTLDYYDESVTGLSTKYIFVKRKTNAQLNAMDPLPPNPFTVKVDVAMTNDEGQTASGTISLKSNWTKKEPPGPTVKTASQTAPPGVTASAFADALFDNAGTNARFTGATFSTLDYYDADRSGVSGGFLEVRAKTRAELGAMSSPPSDPFTVGVTVTMTNNEGQTATGTVDYVTDW